MSIERFRSRGEVEDRERNRRKRQGARNPREDRHHLMERQRQHPLGAEQRSATADGAERERQHAQSRGDVVAAHQQEQDCRAGEHRHLDDHPEVTSRPPVGVRTKGRRPVEQERASRTVLRFDFPVDGSAHAHAVKLTPHLHASGVCREPSVKGHASGPVGPMLGTQPVTSDDSGGVGRTPRRNPRDLWRRDKVPDDVGWASFERKVSRRIAGEGCARASRPEIRPHERHLNDGVENRERDDRDDRPGEARQPLEPNGFRGRGHAPPYYVPKL